MVTCIAKGRKVKKTAMNFASFVILAQRVLLYWSCNCRNTYCITFVTTVDTEKNVLFFLMKRIPLMVNSVKNITKTKVLKVIRLRDSTDWCHIQLSKINGRCHQSNFNLAQQPCQLASTEGTAMAEMWRLQRRECCHLRALWRMQFIFSLNKWISVPISIVNPFFFLSKRLLKTFS